MLMLQGHARILPNRLLAEVFISLSWADIQICIPSLMRQLDVVAKNYMRMLLLQMS